MLYMGSAGRGEGRKRGAVGELCEKELGGGDGSAAKRGQRGKGESRMGQDEEKEQLKGARSVRDEQAQRIWQRAVALGSQTPGSGRGDSAFPASFDPTWLRAVLNPTLLRTSVVPC